MFGKALIEEARVNQALREELAEFSVASNA